MIDENMNMMKRKTEDLRVPKRPSKDEKYNNYKENIENSNFFQDCKRDA